MLRGNKLQISVLSVVMAASAPAMAGDFGFAFNFFKGGRHHHGVNVGVVVGRPAVVAPAPVVVAPAPVVVAPPPVVAVPVVPVRPVYVPPVYTTVAERVWVPTVQTLYRDVPILDVCGRVIGYRREPYTVTSGHWSVVHRRVIAREGYWTTAVGAPPVPAPAPGAVQPDAGPGPDDDYGDVGYNGQPQARPYGPSRGVRASAFQ